MTENERAPVVGIGDTLRTTLGSAESPGLSSTFDRRLSDALTADRGASRRDWKRRRWLQRLTLSSYALLSSVAIVAVLLRLPPPQDPRVVVLSVATLLFVVGASAALAVVLFLVRRGVIEPHG